MKKVQQKNFKQKNRPDFSSLFLFLSIIII
nr:MAG TPA: hypothetical protein [Caudoviricetes sp.]